MSAQNRAEALRFPQQLRRFSLLRCQFSAGGFCSSPEWHCGQLFADANGKAAVVALMFEARFASIAGPVANFWR
jgi:hypothetical protein